MKIILFILGLAGMFFLISKIFPQVKIKSFFVAIGVSIVYGILNYLFSGLMSTIINIVGLITGPLVIIVWLVSSLIANSILLVITDKIFDGFEIENLTWTFITSVIITVSSFLLTKLLVI